MTIRPTPSVCRARRLLLGCLLALGPVGLAACGDRPATVELVGTVADSLVVVVVPAVAMPAVDLDAGFPPAPTAATASSALSPTPSAAGTGSPSGRGGAALAATGLGSFLRVAAVRVHEGSVVAAGDLLAGLDDGILAAQVRTAEAAAATAAAAVPVLDDRVAEVDYKRAQLSDTHRTLTSALSTIAATRTTLTATRARLTDSRATLTAHRATLVGTRDQLVATRTRLQALLDTLPADPTVPLSPGTPTRAQVEAQLAAVTAGLATADAGLARLDAGLAQVGAGLTQVGAGLAQLTAKESQVRSGLANVADGRATLADARVKLVDATALARVAVDTAGVAVSVARQQLALAGLTAPVAGVIVSIAAPGDLLAPGAPVATIRQAGPVGVTGWLAPEVAARVCAGDPARLRGDWMTQGTWASATVTRLGDVAAYPPSSHATDEVHLTRAVVVELTAADVALPPGVPVAVRLEPCRPPP